MVNDLKSRIESLQSYEFTKQTNLLDNQPKDDDNIFSENATEGKLQSSLDVSETGQGHQSPSNMIKPGEELPEKTQGEEPQMTSDRIDVLEELPVNEPTFEDNLMRLNMEWNETVQGIERMCLENHRTTNQWWDFTRLKKKVLCVLNHQLLITPSVNSTMSNVIGLFQKKTVHSLFRRSISVPRG